MKPLLALTAFALILTAACSSGDAATSCSNPNELTGPGPTVSPVAVPPEGTLLLARELPQSLLTLGSTCGVTTLANGTQTWLAPDGSKAGVVLGTGELNTGIAVIDGDGLHTLAEWNRNAGFWPTVAWSNDSKRLAYNRPSTDEPAGVWTWDGRESRRVYTSANAWPIGFTSDRDIVLSPSMKRLKVVDSTGQELQSIEMPFDDFSEGYIISPDEKLAVMSDSDGGMSEPTHSTGLWLYDFGSQDWTRLVEIGASVSSTPSAGLFVSSNAMVAAKARKGTPPPSWSADGERLTYYRVYTTADQVYHAELWLHDFRTNEDKPLTDCSGYGEVWSDDGRHLAYRLMNPTGVGILGPDGQVSEISTGSGPEAWIAWSPDGQLIISDDDKLELHDPESGVTEELRFNGEAISGSIIYASEVHASPSGRYFAFSVTSLIGANGQLFHGKPGVYIVDTQTGEVTRVIDKSGVYVSGWLGE